jgi:enoyl-CoA hydratase/carnithine racemase
MMDDHILFSVVDGLATITFNRPQQRNAVSQAMWRRFESLVSAASADPSVGLILVTGAGGYFISGADLKEYETIHTSRQATISYLDTTSSAFSTLASCAKPTMAVIEGPCMGGGCMIALACDLRLASDQARFCLPPSKLGLFFPLANTKRIVDVVGASVAKDLLFSARVVDAAEALQLRLVNAVYPSASLVAEAEARAREILDNAPSSIARIKIIIARILAGEHEDTPETRTWLLDALGGDDYREGQRAFKERRKARFRFTAARPVG